MKLQQKRNKEVIDDVYDCLTLVIAFLFLISASWNSFTLFALTFTFNKKEEAASPELRSINITWLLIIIIFLRLLEFLLLSFFVGSLFGYFTKKSFAVFLVLLHQTIKFWYSKAADYDDNYKKIDLELAFLFVSLLPYLVGIWFWDAVIVALEFAIRQDQEEILFNYRQFL